MAIYIILVLIILIVFKIDKEDTKALFISFFLLTLVAALRHYEIGADTYQFYRKYSEIGMDISWDYTKFRFEPGFFYLCKISYIFIKDAQALIVITSCFINYSVYRFIKLNSKDYCFSTIMYIFANIFFSYMNIMRQAMALSVCLFAYEYLKRKEYAKYFVLIGIACLFHTVAIANLILWAFGVLPHNKMTYRIAVGAALLSFVFYSQFFSILSFGLGYESYYQTSFIESNYLGALLEASQALLVIGGIVVFSMQRSKEYKNEEINLLIIAGIIYIWFSFLTIRMIVFNRISGLFSIYFIILLPNILEFVKSRNIKDYTLLKNASIFIYFVSFITISLLRPEWNRVIPYKFFWDYNS